MSFGFLVINVCNHAEQWAVHLRTCSRLAPLQARPVCFPSDRSLCEAVACRLAAVGKVKGEGLTPEVSLGGFDFRVRDSSSWFHVINYRVLSLAGPGAGASISGYFLREGYADVRGMFWGKVWFRSCVSKLKFRLCFAMFPGVCLAFASGGAGTSLSPRK